MHTIKVSAGGGSHAVIAGSGALKALPGILRKLHGNRSSRIYILTSPEIWALWGERLLAALPGLAPVVLFLPSGERYKRLGEVERLASELAAAGADRGSLLIAFGGGVTGDLGGFLAAIYMRGIDYIQIPTTFLSQVDSSVGGKTGVNLREGKNLIGAFHHPRAVVADIDLLSTLPPRELRSGLYESVKAGLIRDAALFRYIERNLPAIHEASPKVIETIVVRSIRMKAQVVGLDERESGLRMILNFGHTIGHAIEAACSFDGMLHGEAVAWGMRVALAISAQRKWLKVQDAERAERVIRSLAPPPLPRLRPEKLIDLAAKDKKNRSGARRFILLKGIGNAVTVEDVTDQELRSAIGAMRSLNQEG